MNNIKSYEEVNKQYYNRTVCDRIIDILKRKYPGQKNYRELLHEAPFNYKWHVIDCIFLSEERFAAKQDWWYEKINEWGNNAGRADGDNKRTPFEMQKNVCANFIMEDLLINTLRAHNGDIVLNGDREHERTIYKNPSNLPDFTFKYKGKKIQIELKINWENTYDNPKDCFLRNSGYDKCVKAGNAIVLYLHKNSFTIIDFTNGKTPVAKKGEKWGKSGYFVECSNPWYPFQIGPDATTQDTKYLLKEISKIAERV